MFSVFFSMLNHPLSSMPRLININKQNENHSCGISQTDSRSLSRWSQETSEHRWGSSDDAQHMKQGCRVEAQVWGRTTWKRGNRGDWSWFISPRPQTWRLLQQEWYLSGHYTKNENGDEERNTYNNTDLSFNFHNKEHLKLWSIEIRSRIWKAFWNSLIWSKKPRLYLKMRPLSAQVEISVKKVKYFVWKPTWFIFCCEKKSCFLSFISTTV